MMASPWKRSRYWATAACCAVAAGGVLTWMAGHHVHGALALLGSLLLVRNSGILRRQWALVPVRIDRRR